MASGMLWQADHGGNLFMVPTVHIVLCRASANIPKYGLSTKDNIHTHSLCTYAFYDSVEFLSMIADSLSFRVQVCSLSCKLL